MKMGLVGELFLWVRCPGGRQVETRRRMSRGPQGLQGEDGKKDCFEAGDVHLGKELGGGREGTTRKKRTGKTC